MLDHFFPLLFPKDSEALKIFDIRIREVGAKRPLNGTSKVNRQTHRQTDRRTFRFIELELTDNSNSNNAEFGIIFKYSASINSQILAEKA